MAELCAQVKAVLGNSAYHKVPLGGLFGYVGKMNERQRVTVKPMRFPGAAAAGGGGGGGGGGDGEAAARAAAAAASGSSLAALGAAYSVGHGGRGGAAKVRRTGAAEGEAGGKPSDGFMALTEE
jgi:hypothetical protein